MLKGKKIILGITGSIAAYKAAHLTRLLRKEGVEVKIIMTPYGKEFITPVTLATLSQNTVLSDFFRHDDGSWNSHVDLGIWADLMLIAPATANTIAKMAHGIADNLLLTTYLSARCPVAVAPAMDLDMFGHPSTVRNLEMLRECGNFIIEPAVGELASGLEGKGRMEEPEKILAWIDGFFKKKVRFKGKRVLITAGPTYERIDPVRFIGNFSSGKMGYALASAFAAEGALVTLISGPVSNLSPDPGVELVRVESANEMLGACKLHYPACDIAVFNAAVSDYRPSDPANSKIKRGVGAIELRLTPNPDIAMEMALLKSPGKLNIGFALETEEGIMEAIQKMERKNFDMIVLNSLMDPGAGFGVDTNRVTLIGKGNKLTKIELKSKKEVAEDIVAAVADLLATT